MLDHPCICLCLCLRPSHGLALAHTNACPSPLILSNGHVAVKTISTRNKPPPRNKTAAQPNLSTRSIYLV
ncbi:hypothetical protein SCLCIDRAFT_1214691, partial [Scleroderma citrinum Foug A]